MKEQIIEIICNKSQGMYHLEIDELDLEVISNEILSLYNDSNRYYWLKERIIEIICNKAQGMYYLEIDEPDLEVIANEILSLIMSVTVTTG